MRAYFSSGSAMVARPGARQPACLEGSGQGTRAFTVCRPPSAAVEAGRRVPPSGPSPEHSKQAPLNGLQYTVPRYRWHLNPIKIKL